MPSNVNDFIQKLVRSRKELNEVDSPQLNSLKRRDRLRTLVTEYFNDIRPLLKSETEQDGDIRSVDALMQELVVLCHSRGGVKRYQTLLSKARKNLVQIDARIIASPNGAVDPNKSNVVDDMIINTLTKIIPSAALSYRQALQDLQNEHRHSWRGPATDLREALRETLDHLAPDTDVIAMQGYKKVPDTNGPTMKQKTQYVLKMRGKSKAIGAPAVIATDCVESAVGSFVRSVYTRSSVSTHTPTDKAEVVRIRDFVRVALCELLEIRT